VKQERIAKNLKHKQELEKLIEQRAKISQYIATNQAYQDQKRARAERQAANNAAADVD
jgi:hypothetical protein